MSPDRSWKRRERQAAKALGGRRVPFSGGLSVESMLPKSDVMGVSAFQVIEVKHRKTWSVQQWIRDCEARARLNGSWLLVVSTPKVHGQYAVLPLIRLAQLLREDANIPPVTTRSVP